MDTILFQFLFDLAQSRPFNEIAISLARWGGLAASLAIIGYLGWAVRSERFIEQFKNLTFAFASALIARFGVVELVRALWPRPRPFVAEAVSPLIEHAANPSFPSGHATFLMALAIYFLLASGRREKIIGWLLLVIAVLTSIARIAVGFHWPSDILAGWAIGALVALAVWYLKKRSLDAKI